MVGWLQIMNLRSKRKNMLYNNSATFVAATCFIDSFMCLDAEKFSHMLTEDVSSVNRLLHDQFIAGMNSYSGKAEVIQAYNEKFFNITRNCILHSTGIQICDLQAIFKCEVTESKQTEQGLKKYKVLCHTQLDFTQEDEELKISKIWMDTTKTPLEVEVLFPSTLAPQPTYDGSWFS
jgi:hypothetical protein